MDLNALPKSNRTRGRRVGRGIAAGQGKTAGRGTKGQRARYKIALKFEGGQTPLAQRLPKKRGFRSRQLKWGSKPVGISIATLTKLVPPGELTLRLMKERGLVGPRVRGVKLLGGPVPAGYQLGEGVSVSKQNQ